MVRIFSKVIQERKDNGKDSSEYTDILQLFIEMKYKDGTTLSNDEVVGLLIALLFAGQHTSSITSTWTMMLLLHNPHCLDEVLKEQESIFGCNIDECSNISSDYDIVSKFEYLQNAIKESLRMYPPLIMLMRYAKQDIEVIDQNKKYIIPKGDIVITSPAVSSRLDNIFKNPNNFEPERFNNERNEHKTPFAFLGFGGGMHACMGQQFGLLQVKTIISYLLRNYRFELINQEMPIPDYEAMVVGPKNNLVVRYHKRGI